MIQTRIISVNQLGAIEGAVRAADFFFADFMPAATPRTY